MGIMNIGSFEIKQTNVFISTNTLVNVVQSMTPHIFAILLSAD